MQYLKQSTAVTLKIGPFVDDTDGNTAETGLTIAQADVRLSKNGANIAQKIEATSCTHDELGIYGCPVDATDTATLGRLQLWVHESGALPVWHEYMVLPANVFDSMFSTDKLEVDVTQLLGTAWLTPSVAGTPDVNTKLLGGTSQTGNDVGSDVDAILTDTGTTLDALIKDTPTVAEFEARSILSADYVVVGDTIAGVTAVTNDVGITQAGADKVRASVCVTGDPANSIGKVLYEIYANRLTSTRAGYLDNLSVGAVALASGVDITKIHGAALTETVNGYLAAAFTKLFDVATPLLISSEAMRGTDSAALAANYTATRAGYLDNVNNANLATIADISTLTSTEIAYLNASISSRSSHAASAIWSVGTRALTDKAGFALSSAGITSIWNKNISAYSGVGYAGTYVKTLYDDWINAGRLDAILDIIAADVVNIDGAAMRGTDSANTTTPPTVNEIADQVWDEILTGAAHNIATSAGRRLREVGAYAIESGTAQAGTATTITLAATADGGDGIFNRNLIVIVDGTGAGQTRTITDYNNTTKVCAIDREWRINPNATSEYQILADDTPLVVDHGVAQGGTSTTITLRAYASATNDAYLCNIIAIIGGTGRGQARLVGSYVGATKVVTICGDNWVTTPDTTSVYTMVPYGTSCASCMGTTALTEINAECDTALTDYDPPTRTEATADKDAIITEVDANETKIDTIDGVVDAIKAKTDNLPSGIQKNVALSNFSFLMTDTSDDPKTGLTVTVQISKDGGAFATVSNSVVEITNGYYKIDLTQSEMNADVIAFKATATGANQTSLVVVTS